MKLKELLKLFDLDQKIIIETSKTYLKGQKITLDITTFDLNTEVNYITLVDCNYQTFIYIKGE